MRSTRDWPKDLLHVGDLTCVALADALDLAARMRAKPQGWTGALAGEALACLFDEPAARPALSVAGAAHRLGMVPVMLDAEDLLSAGSEDAPRLLSEGAAAVFVRVGAERTLRAMARAVGVPVINALSPEHHPCQALADLLTLRARFGRLEGLALAYVGDVGGTAHSLMEAGGLAGMDLRVGCPADRRPAPEVLAEAEILADRHGGTLTVTEDPAEAVAGADAVSTDRWRRRPGERPPDGYRVDGTLMHLAKPQAAFLHCLPARRGEEVARSVIDGPRSVVAEQAANRLPAEQAVIYALVTAARGRSAAAERRRWAQRALAGGQTKASST